MTWLGKILTVMVFLLALCWVWLTALSFATRTNWKTSSDKYKAALEQSESLRKREYDAAQSKIADLSSQLAEARKSAETSAERNAELARALDSNQKDYYQVTSKIEKGDVEAVTLAANLKAAQDELDAARKRSASLEDERQVLSVALQVARNNQSAAEADARQARGREEDAYKRIDFLQAQVSELKQRAGSGGGLAGGVFDTGPPPVPEGARGTVTAYADGLVVLSIGLDAGLSPGVELQLSRLTGGGKYLGTVVVTDVRPKMAVARFKPPFPKRIDQLKPDELPTIGDRVEKSPTTTGLR